MDVLIFSKDRAFQLYSTLETLIKHVQGIDTIYVQFHHSHDRFLKGYELLNQHFQEVIFIDEVPNGFNNTLTAIINQEITSTNLFMEVDDNIYFEDVGLIELEEKFNNLNASKLTVNLDISLFNSKNYIMKEGIVVVDKLNKIDNPIQDLCLKYPFNVSNTIHRLKDLKLLLSEDIYLNPIDLESKGSSSKIFTSYPYISYNPTEVCKQIHTNNFGQRYEEVYNIEILNTLILNHEVLDIEPKTLKSYSTDMRWFNGEDIGRFPIFPWEVPPIHHKEIIENRKPLEL
tara:strand:- start:1649 stop:2509 length:861 start_codon:yes stop_codon:yes gene_type:complete